MHMHGLTILISTQPSARQVTTKGIQKSSATVQAGRLLHGRTIAPADLISTPSGLVHQALYNGLQTGRPSARQLAANWLQQSPATVLAGRLLHGRTRSGLYFDIYAQRISSSGAIQWSADDGVAICKAGYSQWHPTIISDGSGGAIITWQDGRSGNYDIYAQRIYKDGKLSGGCIVLPILQLLLLD
jgi:hypothetical protein